MGAGDALERIDVYLAGLLGVIVLAYVVTYALFPPCMPDQRGKPSFFTWVTGTGCLTYYHRYKDSGMSAGDFPEASGTEHFNIELFVEMLEKRWTSASKGRLHSALLRWSLPWLLFAHIFQGFPRALDLLEPMVTSSIISYMSDADASSLVMMKVAALSAMIRLTKTVCHNCCQTVLAIRGVNPIWAGLSLMVLRRMHGLSLEAMVMKGVSSTLAQQIGAECRDLAPRLMDVTPLKTCLVDIFIGVYALMQLGRLCGVTVLICGVLFAVTLYFLSSFAARKQIETGGAVFYTNLERTNTLNMMLERFRELKMYNWANRLSSHLEFCRTSIWKETLRGKGWAILCGLLNTVMNPSIVVVYYVVLVFINGRRVDFNSGIVAFTYMVNVSWSLFALSGCRGSYLDCYYRAERIENFLRLPQHGDRRPVEGALKLDKVTYGFEEPASQNAEQKTVILFADLDLKPRDGELVLVTGSLGCGKSTLLSGLIGELPVLAGKAALPKGVVAYQPQLPYLLDGTIRDNIIFGIPDSECDEKHLQRSLVASQLAVEMDDCRSTLHAKREQTRVGKRGSQLSGGQRARVALARTVYAVLQGACLAVLDDPLASVDNEVVHATWEAAIRGELRSVTRVVAVNTQLLERLAPTADRIVVVGPGRTIAFDSTAAELMQQKERLAEVLGGDFQLGGVVAQAEPAATELAVSNGVQQEVPNGVQEAAPASTEPEVSNGVPPEAPPVPPAAVEEDGDPVMSLANLVRECVPLNEFVAGNGGEGLKLTPADWQRLWSRLKALQGLPKAPPAPTFTRAPLCWVILKLFVRTRGLTVLTMMLNVFKNAASPLQFKTIQSWEAGNSNWGDKQWLVYFTLQVSLFSLIDTALANLDSMAALISSCIFRRELDEKAMALGLPFFWGSAGGAEVAFRRITHFDPDVLVGIIRMPMAVMEVLCTLVALVYSNAETMASKGLLVALGLAAAGFYQSLRISSWKNVQLINARIEVMTKVDLDVVDQFDSLLVMRSLGRNKHFERLLLPGFMKEVYWNWMRCSGELIIGLISAAIAAMFTAFAAGGVSRIKAASQETWVAFLFWNMTNAFFWNVNGAVEAYMPFQESLGRYREFETFLGDVRVESQEGREPQAAWPSHGHITFRNVTFHYAHNLPPAIKDVCLEVQAGEKLGVVGRTGSGKSTLVSLLLRLGPVHSGRVLLDGVDVASLRVSDLRRAVAVVPQEPTVFGPWSLRANVGDEFSEAEVLTVLGYCGLDPRQLTDCPDDLRTALHWRLAPHVTVGQQQLLMAARALARRPRVLILDECTAAIDRENADKLLEVIREQSAGTTVLAVAHRLRFVLGSDRVLVLGHCGEILGLDTPEKVLEDESGYFAVNLRLEQVEHGESKVA